MSRLSSCVYKQLWDFEDYKGWGASIGIREEGQITWRNEHNDLVKDGTCVPGFSYAGFVPNDHLAGDGFKTFTEAVEAFELALFGENVNGC